MDMIKEMVFEKLAMELAKNEKSRRANEQLGYQELAQQCIHQSFGIQQAVIALGYDIKEFETYYKSNRAKYRKEVAA